MTGALAGKVAVITGGASGIGLATAREAAAQGADVVVLDIDEQGGERAAAEVRAAGGTSSFQPVDLASPDSIRAAMRVVEDGYGRIDVLVNNGATTERTLVPSGQSTTVAELPEEYLDLIYAVNFKSVLLCAKYALPALRKAAAPSIVNAGSTGGMVAYYGGAVYGALKAAVIMLTKSMATEFAEYGIRVNCYCPSPIDTPFLARIRAQAEDGEAVAARQIAPSLLGRLGRPDEVAAVICFLASDAASYLTGVAIPVDGGTLAWRGQGRPTY